MTGPPPAAALLVLRATGVLEHAPVRLRAQNADPVILFKVGLLALPYDERWTQEIWDKAPSTN